ncbi:MAG: hypothetical protein ACR2PL_21830, partial [Dehalococcoidia bacterium]
RLALIMVVALLLGGVGSPSRPASARSKTYGGAAAAGRTAPSVSSAPQSPLYGVNLIQNGDADGGPASDPPYVSSADIPHWINSGVAVVPYGAAGGFPTTSQGSLNPGQNFFAGGLNATAQAVQTIDVSSIATTVDTTAVTFELFGWFGGFGSQADAAQMDVTFLGSNGKQIGSYTNTIGPVTATDRQGTTGLLPRQAFGFLLGGTRQIRVVLSMTRVSGDYNDGYADSLSLVLTPPLSKTCSPTNPAPGTATLCTIHFSNLDYVTSVTDTITSPPGAQITACTSDYFTCGPPMGGANSQVNAVCKPTPGSSACPGGSISVTISSPSTGTLAETVTQTTAFNSSPDAEQFSGQAVWGLRGDVNRSGRADAVDALCVLRSVAGLALTPACPYPPNGLSDSIWHVSNSGRTINAVDALCILRSVARLAASSACPS